MTSPKLATTTNRGRMYTHPTTGATYPSVTTVLGTVGKGDALKHWAALEVAKYAVKNRETWQNLDPQAAVDLLKREPLRFLDRAASRGTDVHALAETYAKTGTMPDYANEIGGYVDALLAFFKQHQPEPVLVEATVFDSEVGFAGSFDMVCKLPALGDGLVILDYKTSKAIYPEVAAQLAAYAHAEQYITDDGSVHAMPNIDKGVAVRFAADGEFEVIECDIEEGWRYFQQVRKVYDINTKGFLLGKVQPPIIDDSARTDRKDKLVARINNIKDTTPAALKDAAAQWPVGIPTFKSDHTHTMNELVAIERMLDKVEGDHNVPFGNMPITKTTPKPPPKPVQVAALPSEGVTVDEQHIADLRTRLNKSTTKIKEAAKTLAKEASANKTPISLTAKPSMRRYLLAQLMIDALELGDGDSGIIEAIVRSQIQITTTLGAALGSCDIEQITKMSTLFKSIKDGNVTVTYNTDNGTYTVQEG
jgi:hypothetical protein